ncbi:hypothetical protein BJP36_11645 [Moorena producens JHB]|uniref:Uncharacterized protein n=1 Tax=Moorena producens (strain JHB) TaxID=1454205 RepID=A0A1D9FZ78_MOOP1|nr:hypothetical protein [Moorena producens]AOY80470.1 hypothetical protein BJP36_11645 [Moorena producens JHB]
MPGDSNTSNFNISKSVYYANNTGGIAGNSVTADLSIANEHKQTLAETAAEIQQLLDQVSQTNPTTTNKEKMIVVGEVVDKIENNPTLKVKVINSLKAGGVEAFKEAIDHPLVNILMAVIEGWTEVE